MHEARGAEAESGRQDSVCVTRREREKEDHINRKVLEGSSCKRF